MTPTPHCCLSCHKPESSTVRGGLFTSNGDNGMIITFWLCDSCALPLGPGQGKIDLDAKARPPV